MRRSRSRRAHELPFWFGESDEPTPALIRDAAIRSLNDGETFYAHNLGLPELREALSAYVSGLHGPVRPERIAATSSGVNALMLAMQALAGPDDEVVAVVPLWPNLTAQRRRTGTWIGADEVYERVFFDGPTVAEPPQGGRRPPRGGRSRRRRGGFGADRCRRQADRVQHFLRADLCAARRAGRARRRG